MRKVSRFKPYRATVGLLSVLALTAPAAATDMFPDQRPQSETEAARTLAAHGTRMRGCLTPELQLVQEGKLRFSPPQIHAASWLSSRARFARGEGIEQRLGLTFAVTPAARARLNALSPALRESKLDAIARGVTDTRRVLSTTVGLPQASVRVLLADLGGSTDGYAVDTAPRAEATIVLDVDTASHLIYRTAAHQYAHAVARSVSPRLPATWGEAFAVWTTLRALGLSDSESVDAIDRRIGRLDAGLTSDDPRHSVGNAIWLTYLESRWGLAAVRSTIEELALGGEIADALDRGIKRVSTLGLEQAFADFQLWTLFTGGRDDTRHLLAANQLALPGFTSTVASLPALSIQRDPGLAPWGGSRILVLDTPLASGGLRIGFEGDFSAQWSVDLILTSGDHAMHRLPLILDDGRVEITVPLDNLTEAVLLVRRIDGEDPELKSYSYSVHREAAYPFELVEARVEEVDSIGLLVEWETAAEQDVLGYNVLRSRAEGGLPVVVNPVWIPGLGGSDRGVGYRFMDRSAAPNVNYEYRIQAITTVGLTSHSAVIPSAIRR